MELEQDPSRLPIYELINLLGLNPITITDMFKCQEFLIKNNYLNVDHVIRYYRDSEKQNFFLILIKSETETDFSNKSIKSSSMLYLLTINLIQA